MHKGFVIEENMKWFFDKCINKIAKNSFVFFSIVIISITLILMLSISIKTDNIITKEASISNNIICIETEVKIDGDNIFVYSDRNEKVYIIRIEEFYYKDGCTYIVANSNDVLGVWNLAKINVDIPVGQSTLFERIFIRGGKTSG
jgi:hypothetical protein